MPIQVMTSDTLDANNNFSRNKELTFPKPTSTTSRIKNVTSTTKSATQMHSTTQYASGTKITTNPPTSSKLRTASTARIAPPFRPKSRLNWTSLLVTHVWHWSILHLTTADRAESTSTTSKLPKMVAALPTLDVLIELIKQSGSETIARIHTFHYTK